MRRLHLAEGEPMMGAFIGEAVAIGLASRDHFSGDVYANLGSLQLYGIFTVGDRTEDTAVGDRLTRHGNFQPRLR